MAKDILAAKVLAKDHVDMSNCVCNICVSWFQGSNHLQFWQDLDDLLPDSHTQKRNSGASLLLSKVQHLLICFAPISLVKHFC